MLPKSPRTHSLRNAWNLTSTKRFHLNPILPNAEIDQLLLHRAHEAFWPTDEVLGLRILQEEILRAIQGFQFHAADVVVVYAFHILLLLWRADEEGSRDVAVLLGCISDVLAEGLH